MRLEGHVALVTGANRNIGRAIALELAGRGCAVIVNASRSREEAEAVAAEARRHGVKATALLADVAVPRRARRSRNAPSPSSARWTCSSTTPPSVPRRRS